MSGKRNAQKPSDVAPDTQPPAKRQTRDGATGGSGAAPTAIAAAEEATVTISFTMRGDPSVFMVQKPTPPVGSEPVVEASALRKAALEASALRIAELEAALGKFVTEWGFRDLKVVRTRGGASEDTLQQVLPLVLERMGPERGALCFLVCKAWRRELEARGFCIMTVNLCSLLAKGVNNEHLRQSAQRRLDTSTGEAERALCLDANAFLERSRGWYGSLEGSLGSLADWLQAASQEPDASFLSRGAASTARALGLPLVRWVGKPQRRGPGSYTPTGNATGWPVGMAFSADGTRVVTWSLDGLVKIWITETGAKVSILE